MAGKVTAGLAESNGSLLSGLWLCMRVAVGLVGGGGSRICMLSPAGWLLHTGSAPFPKTRPLSMELYLTSPYLTYGLNPSPG